VADYFFEGFLSHCWLVSSNTLTWQHDSDKLFALTIGDTTLVHDAPDRDH
jgi:hypothetical protein